MFGFYDKMKGRSSAVSKLIFKQAIYSKENYKNRSTYLPVVDLEKAFVKANWTSLSCSLEKKM